MKKFAAVVLPLLFAISACSGCKKKDDDLAPPPPPPAPAPVPTPVVIAPEEDAAADAPADAPPDAKKLGYGAPPDASGLRACCNALQQNAASMPPPNNAYALQAAAMCQAMVAAMGSGAQSKAGALAAIGGAMKGMGLPPACR